LLKRGLDKRLNALEDGNKDILKAICNLLRQEACNSPKNTGDHVPICESKSKSPMEKIVDSLSAKYLQRNAEAKI